MPALAADLVNRKVDVIGANGGSALALAVQKATTTIPIFLLALGPIRSRLVSSPASIGREEMPLATPYSRMNSTRRTPSGTDRAENWLGVQDAWHVAK